MLLPYAALLPVATAIGRLAPDLAAGALLLAIAPAELAAPALARLVGGRMETAAALLTGTLVVSFALMLATLGTTGGSGAIVNTALVAFLVGVSAGGALPQLRDALLVPIRAAANVALAILVVSAVLGGIAALEAITLVAAAALLVTGLAAAAVAAVLFGGDARAAGLGGGTRDFAVAATLAAGVRPEAAALPLAYGALLFLAAALAGIAHRERERRLVRTSG